MPNLSDYNPAVKYGSNLDINVDLADIRDESNNEMLEFDSVASAAGYIYIRNASGTNNPIVAASGAVDTGLTFQNDQGEEILILDSNASAVNEVSIDNAAASSNPEIAATGDDTNISLQLSGKGTGLALVGDAGSIGRIVSGSVTLNDQRGRVDSGNLTTAAGAVASFDLVNDKIGADSALLLTLQRGSNTAGSPVLQDYSIGVAGSATIRVLNASQGTALSGSVVVGFLVLS